jgi:hypothetical protein
VSFEGPSGFCRLPAGADVRGLPRLSCLSAGRRTRGSFRSTQASADGLSAFDWPGWLVCEVNGVAAYTAEYTLSARGRAGASGRRLRRQARRVHRRRSMC